MITSAEQATHTSQQSRPWGILFFNSAIGMLFMLVNFPMLLQHIILSFVGSDGIGSVFLDVITKAQFIVADLVGPNPQDTFQTLIFYSFIGLWLYIIALTIFSLRHRSFAFLALGIAGLLVGIVALHLISWIALLVVVFVQILDIVIGFIANLLEIVFTFLIRYGLWIFLVILALYLLYEFRDYLAEIVVGALLAIGAAYILYRVLPAVWRWFVALIRPIIEFIVTLWTRFINPIITFLWTIISVILLIGGAIIVMLGVLATLGHLAVDQIKAAWHAGNGRKGVMLGAFGIGTALALIFLTSVANPKLANSINTGWTLSWYLLDDFVGTNLGTSGMAHAQLTDSFVKTLPAGVRSFVFQNLTAASAPLYDTFLLLVVLAISYIGILRRVFPRLADPPESVPVTFYPTEYFAIFGGLIVQVTIVFLQALVEGEG